MGEGQHACLQEGVLGLGLIIVCEDVTLRASLGAQSALLRVSRTRKSNSSWSVTSLLVSLFSVSLAALGEFADDGAGLVSTVGQPASV